MAARSVSWDSGTPIPGTGFRHMIVSADTDGRFSCQSATLAPHHLVMPHSHRFEDEFTFVHRGRIGGRVGDQDVVVEEGGFLFKPRGLVHALWNPTEEEAIVLEFISPAGFERFFEEMGALPQPAPQASLHEIATRYGHTPHPELVAQLTDKYHLTT
jgi:quercetin dioxygenase-like cupin family protein